MAKKTISELKAEINQRIKSNGNREISGTGLNQVLIDMVDTCDGSSTQQGISLDDVYNSLGNNNPPYTNRKINEAHIPDLSGSYVTPGNLNGQIQDYLTKNKYQKLNKVLDSINNKSVDDVPTPGVSGLTVVWNGYVWNYDKIGSGGGTSKPGHQSVYFTNANKSDNVVTPIPSDYVKADNKFVVVRDNYREWVSTNFNPQEGQYTYAIWVYFDGDGNIFDIDGPVILNSGGGGTNGEDGEEIEWIYCRFTNELTTNEESILAVFLQSQMGNMQAKNGKTFEDEDAVPLDFGPDLGFPYTAQFTDNPQGITEEIKYEYAAFRKSSNNSIGKRTWGTDYFHGPVLWSAYGKQGMDGDGVEYIFFANGDGSNPTGINLPQNWNDSTDGKDGKHFQDNEFIALGSDWMDDPIDLAQSGLGQGAVEWVSMRKKQNDIWQPYSPPAVWTRLALDGGAPIGISGTTYFYKATEGPEKPTRGADVDPSWTEGAASSPAWSVSYPYLWEHARTDYVDGSHSWGNICFRGKWAESSVGPAGPAGKDAISFDIIPNPAAVKFYVDSNNVPKPDNVVVKVKGICTSGTTSTEFTDKLTIGSTTYTIGYKTYKTDGLEPTMQFYSGTSQNGITVTATTGNYNDLVTNINFYLGEPIDGTVQAIIKEIAVPVSRDGLKGQDGSSSTGQVGRFYYFGGNWDDNDRVLTVSEHRAPYVQDGENYYVYTAPADDPQGMDMSHRPSENSAQWEQITYNKFLMSDAMFADYAHIGGAVINRDWLISQYGTLGGNPASPRLGYTTFDPIAFMSDLRKGSGGADIGVITRYSGTPGVGDTNESGHITNSQLFCIKQRALITLEFNGAGTKEHPETCTEKATLVEITDESYNYRADNQGVIPPSAYREVGSFDYQRVGDDRIDTDFYASKNRLTYGSTFCIMNGSAYNIKIEYTNPVNVFYPHYAVDMKSGFSYMNNAYINGEIRAKKYYQAHQDVTIDSTDVSNTYGVVESGVQFVSVKSTSTASTTGVHHYLTLPSASANTGVTIEIYSFGDSTQTKYVPFQIDNLYKPNQPETQPSTSEVLKTGQHAKVYSNGTKWVLLEGPSVVYDTINTDKLVSTNLNKMGGIYANVHVLNGSTDTNPEYVQDSDLLIWTIKDSVIYLINDTNANTGVEQSGRILFFGNDNAKAVTIRSNYNNINDGDNHIIVTGPRMAIAVYVYDSRSRVDYPHGHWNIGYTS